MYYVYLIRQSVSYPDQIYIGYTKDLKQRLEVHNSGNSFYTAQFRPWELEVFICFKSEIKAIEFEKYLKSGSGRAFAAKKLWSK